MANEYDENVNECTHNCSTCGSDCASKGEFNPEDFRAQLAMGASVKHVYAIMSGKGGVGKSMVTSLLAAKFMQAGKRVAILDADITGPSIPKAFGLEGQRISATEDGSLMFPSVTANGIQVMSANLLLENATDPIVWRGSLISTAVKQFYEETLWEDVDYMFVDMPPGTGDVPLTVFQSLPVDGIVIVTSPQDLVSMIVGKAVIMAKKMNLPVVGLVENMSYLECPDCGKRIEVFGHSKIEEVAKEYGLSVLAKVPIDPQIAELMDNGHVEEFELPYLQNAYDTITRIDKVFG
ncbi:MAG: Mrp/NBP35 family ATP-binding protein [Eubacteriales bacterium]|nr:Mrp/NBP35 family ATP-binding protein [Eubacteriales bacterium]